MADKTTAKANGRIGLLGNPSDIYGGKVISFTFSNHACACVENTDEFCISGNGHVEKTLEYNGKNDLIKAAIKMLGIQNKSMRVSYSSNIPVGAGLAGSSAIIIATMKALNEHYSLGLDPVQIAELALHAEVDELKWAAGPQDRYVISLGGMVFMDFTGKEYLRMTDPAGKWKRLNVNNFPFFLCLSTYPKTSAAVHNPLRSRFLRGEYQIKERMDEIAALAEQGVAPLEAGDWKKTGELMNQNTLLREALSPHLSVDLKIIKQALEYGAIGAKVAGSGGAVIVLGDDSVMQKMMAHYPCMKPEMVL
ncbi:hypothetical protein HY486_02585 [Candidatus Woesearchaeota archaeon]|nr:hypothetical protein [Candidatus Woesearchaeota archaeon]